jgi:hypothetical protein
VSQQIADRDRAPRGYDRYRVVNDHRDCRALECGDVSGYRLVERQSTFLYKYQRRNAGERLRLRRDTEDRGGHHSGPGFAIAPPDRALVDRPPVLQYECDRTRDTAFSDVPLEHAVDSRKSLRIELRLLSRKGCEHAGS